MESRKEVSGLRDRWHSIPGLRLREALLHLDRTPFGQTSNGLHDFRGAVIEGALHQLGVANVDFAYSVMGVTGQLGGKFEATNCRFDKCKYESSIDGVFEKCSFEGSKLNSSTMREQFLDCNFSKASLSKVRGSQVVFRGCKFVSTDFTKACFYDCRFAGCEFDHVRFGGGSLAGSSFENCRFEEVDWQDTILDGVSGIR